MIRSKVGHSRNNSVIITANELDVRLKGSIDTCVRTECSRTSNYMPTGTPVYAYNMYHDCLY